jgi:hypothetical protein
MENTYLASRIGARPGRREAASGVVHQIESSRVVFGLGMELDLIHGGAQPWRLEEEDPAGFIFFSTYKVGLIWLIRSPCYLWAASKSVDRAILIPPAGKITLIP